MIGKAIRLHIVSYETLNSYLNGRIYPSYLDKDTTLPAVTYDIISTLYGYAQEGATGHNETRIQFSVYATSHMTAEIIELLIRAALSGYRGTAGGVDILSCGRDTKTTNPARDIDKRRITSIYTVLWRFPINVSAGGILATGTAAPRVDFTASATVGTAPLSVTFTHTLQGSAVLSYLWDFGDGSTSNLENPTHTYTGDGPYTVSLTVSGIWGEATETKIDYIDLSFIVLDTFTAPDGTQFENYTGTDVKPVGSSWAAVVPSILTNLEINNNSLVSQFTTDARLYIETTVSDCVMFLDITSSSRSAGILFRLLSGNSYSYARLTTDQLQIVTVEPSIGATVIGSVAYPSTPESYTIKLTLSGSSITALVNGYSLSVTSSLNISSTLQGILVSRFDNTDNAFDNFKVLSL